MPSSYSLFELNEYIRRVVALNFSEPIWVHAEIAQLKEVRGNVYLDLVSHDDKSGEVDAQIAGNIWVKNYFFLKNKLGTLLSSILCEGSQILMKVQVEFHERYGLKLVIEDIDPSYTIGVLEMNRQKILQRLMDEGLMEKNKRIPVARVLQRIAIISSEQAAGYIDFVKHIQYNNFGYKYSLTVFPASMQGQNTEREICNALKKIEELRNQFDCVVLIRGGGSKMDLSWFDNYAIGAAIASLSLPVITGIGHEIDTTVCDAVSGIACKTPTAAADFLIQRTAEAESEMVGKAQQISLLALRILQDKKQQLSHLTHLLHLLPVRQIQTHQNKIEHIRHALSLEVKHTLDKRRQRIEQIAETLILYHPENVLKRGYAIVLQGNQYITQSSLFQAQKDTQIEFFDGKINIPGHE